ncbi:hypothetical protein N9C68_05950 [Gammaproteobacteria bacterium]|jgi:hypothetical protein|nr:hypothetical protein [SAR86 cluster bacterium]MDA8780983.1 hypothetical protein [Gammaproteobacteria bacterium]MDA9947335.1 hypothetical protein [bacterium]MBL6822539.1 hypothetical protein [SAR86 cluster bacterium]MDA9205384.1 hypothetical protein [Gammaproteobacteria bacterium]
MKKEELVEIFSDLHPEDTAGHMTGEIHLADGRVIKTDSLRVDMDGGRIILSEKDSAMYDANKRNWVQELIFYKNKKRISA